MGGNTLSCRNGQNADVIQACARASQQRLSAIRALDRPDAAAIPIFAMTANAFDEDRRNALASGMNGFLSKPIIVGDLVQELRKILSDAHSPFLPS